MKIALFGKRRQSAVDVAKIIDLLASLKAMRVFTAIEQRFYTALVAASGQEALQVDDIIEDGDFTADFAFSIGGDGTFLATARAVADKEIPIAGFNTGTLGFLAEESLDSATEILGLLEKGEYDVEKRGLIEVRSRELASHFHGWPVALNEVAVLRHDSDAMITVNASLDGRELATVRGDGLIVATPTGSTAYNLSVGGPIVAPTAPCRIIAPVAPHSLTMRPMVVSDACEIGLGVKVRGDSYRLNIDGRGITLPATARLSLRTPGFMTHVIHRKGHNFVETLRQKLSYNM